MLRELISNYTLTFYDHRVGRQRSITPHYIYVTCFSAFCSLLFSYAGDNLLLGVITYQSILIGFSFSVMFFIVSGQVKETVKHESLEEELRRDKISAVINEIFYCSAYFSAVGIACLVTSLFLLLPAFKCESCHDEYQTVLTLFPHLAEQTLNRIPIIFGYGGWFIFYCFLIESFLAFIRTLMRVNYLFKRKLMLPQV